MGKLTIYDIKRLAEEKGTFYFERKTMKFFGQTLKDFSVYKQKDGKYYISAIIKDSYGIVRGKSERVFNPLTNDLEPVEYHNEGVRT